MTTGEELKKAKEGDRLSSPSLSHYWSGVSKKLLRGAPVGEEEKVHEKGRRGFSYGRNVKICF